VTVKEQNEVVWGVEFGSSGVRAVRLRRTPEGFLSVSVEVCREADLNRRWDIAPSLAEAVAHLGVEALTEPVIACISDELVLYRSMSLPDADPAATAKMVAGQLEVMIPNQTDKFVSGFLSGPDPCKVGHRRVLLCAARRDAVTEVYSACRRMGRGPDAVVPSILALATVWLQLGRDDDRPIALLDVGARCSCLAVLNAGQVVKCAVIDQGGDHWTELIAEKLNISLQQAEQRKCQYSGNPSAAQDDPQVYGCIERAMADWSRQLREAYRHCLESLPSQCRPVLCILFGRSAIMPGLAELVASSLNVEVRQASALGRLELPEGVEFEWVAPAIGAAMCAMGLDANVVDLAPVSKPRRGQVKKWRQWAALAAWALVALFAMYGLDVRKADKLDRTLSDLQGKAAGQGGLDRRLSIGAYLESGGPPPLAVLDRLSGTLPDQAQMLSLNYTRSDESADVVIGAILPNEKDLPSLLEKLGRMGDADLKSTRPEKKQCRFEIHLTLGRSLKPASRPAVPATQPATQPTTQPATQPAIIKPVSQPSTAPASSPARPEAEQSGPGQGGQS